MTQLTLGSVHERVFMLRHKGDFYMLVYTFEEHDRYLKTDRSGPFTTYEINRDDNTLMWCDSLGARYIKLERLVTKWDAAEHDQVFRAAVVKFAKRVHTGSWSNTALVCPPMCAPITYTEVEQVAGAPILYAELDFTWRV